MIIGGRRSFRLARRLALGASATLVLFPAALRGDELNDTGAAVCHDAGGVRIACAAPPAGDDGRYGRDAAASSGLLPKRGAGPDGFDFTKIGNDGSELSSTAAIGSGPASWACTRDNATGLTWEVKTTGASEMRSRRNHYTWYNANAAENGGNAGSRRIAHYSSCNDTLPECNTEAYVARINELALCGFRDWRLPTPGELRGIVNYSLGDAGEFNTGYFTPPDLQWPSPHYWTSATYAADPSAAWLVEIHGEADGGGAGHNHPKDEERLILLVRGAPPPIPGECNAGNPRANVAPSTPGSRFVDNRNGTITDLETSLVWKRCAEGLSGETCETGVDESYVWSAALALAESSTFAGFSDWRVPNLKELHSIVETCGHGLAINQAMFPNTPFRAGGPVYWTSTPDPANAENAFLVHFDRGGAVPGNKSTSKIYLRLVRGGAGFATFDAQNPRVPGRRRLVER